MKKITFESGSVLKAEELNRLQDNADADISAVSAKVDSLEATTGSVWDTYDAEFDSQCELVPNDVVSAKLKSVGGKTIVWNQYASGVQANGGTSITYTNENDVQVTIPTTFADNCGIYYNKARDLTTGEINHKLLISAIVNIPKSAPMRIGISDGGQTVAETINVSTLNTDIRIATIQTCTRTNGIPILFANAKSAGWTSGDSFYVRNMMQFDLTKMFGAGNEPTVDEFFKMFPADYYPFNVGELMNADVVEVESNGKNLLNVMPGATNTNRGVKTIVNQDGSIHFKGTATSAGYADISVSGIRTFPAGTYTFSSVGEPRENTAFVLIDGTNHYDGAASATFTIDHDFTISRSGVAVNNGEECDFTVRFQLERGTTATPYSPCGIKGNFEIPQSIRDLCPGYGWSAGSAYNYIDFENKKYVQNVSSVDLGTLNWNSYSNYTSCFNSNVVGKNNGVSNLMAARYAIDTSSLSNWVESDINMAIKGINDSGYVVIRDKGYSTAESFKTAMSGVMLYYELATPIEVDLSDILKDDPFLVEAGGSLTFKNSLGDDYRIPVPSTVTFSKPKDLVNDVKINGSSIVVDGVADIPVATTSILGVTRRSTQSAINARSTSYSLSPDMIDYAVKAAMCDGKGAAWTDAEKLAARERMGLGGDFELIEEITLAEDSQIKRDTTPDGRAYNFRRIYIQVEMPANSIVKYAYLNAAIKNSVSVRSYFYARQNEVSTGHFDVSCENGFITSRSVHPTHNLTDQGYVYETNYMDFADSIKSISLWGYSSGSSVFFAGTKIKIYGAWA